MLFWVFYVFANSGISKLQAPNSFLIEDQVAKYVLAILQFYLIFAILTIALNKNVLLLFFLCLIPSLFYFLFKYIIYFKILPEYTSYPEIEFKPKQFYITGLWWIFHFSIYSLAYWYFGKAIKEREKAYMLKEEGLKFKEKNILLEKEKMELMSEKTKLEAHAIAMEAEKTKAEFNYLKAQINPHFLYNTLNMFYGQVAGTMPQTGKGIMLLTEIMRYSLNSGSREDSRVYLDEELEQLDNYIELQQLRFNNQLMIRKKITGDTSGIRILPHVFITFTENAIKYGETHNPDTPIEINIAASEKEVVFSIKNNIGRSAKDSSGTGLGIENAFNRMKLQYGELLHYAYGKDEVEMTFYVQFKITLTPDMIKRKTEIPAQTAAII